MRARFLFAALILCLVPAVPALASDVGYLYGRVEMKKGATYEGQLRWGTEESFWDDMFNATKRDNEFLHDVDDRDLDDRRHYHDHEWKRFFFGDHFGDHDFTHVFAARFGDLKRIEVKDGDDLVVTFRNGESLKLEGGSNDVGAEITVVDPRRGQHELRWDRIRSIEFMATPAQLTDKLGDPIYGTVKSGKYEFTGRIQWDNDECLSVDKLDGYSEDGKTSIPFAEIAAIHPHRSGSMVKLKSGDELYLRGTNDVNDENRGIVVIVPKIGTVKVGWDDFDEVTFTAAPNTGPSYAEYGDGKDLNGTVVTKDGRHEGRLVFDLDESLDLEMLQGKNGDTEFLIPFRNIAKIKPRGGSRADVELRGGLTVELEDSHDVTRDNDGLLIYTGDRKPQYVAWDDVTEVLLR